MPIVTWTQPYQAAARLLGEAGEHLEFHRYSEARMALQMHIGHVRELLAQIEREESAAREREAAQAAARLTALRSMLGGGGDGASDWGA
jgi:hypothetical protein